MKLAELTTALINVGEKSAQIARLVRSKETLFKLLVEEKKAIEKNNKFIQDFKTLTDVLVQETIKHDLEKKFPGLAESVLGEECNIFTNSLGETICVQVKDTVKETRDLLVKVLDGDNDAANLLAEAVHATVEVDIEPQITQLEQNVPLDEVGIWIDPIDGTYQYIKCFDGVLEENGVYSKGSQCVTVLIGAYSKTTGRPFLGIVNQPFFQENADTKQWSGKCHWGISYNGFNLSSLKTLTSDEKKHSVTLSNSETDETKSKLAANFHICYSAGAGYKILIATQGLVDAYYNSLVTIYKWDTCGPHAILLSLGGGMVDGAKLMEHVKSNNVDIMKLDKDLADQFEIKYAKPDCNEQDRDEDRLWSNTGGILTYTSVETLRDVVSALM